MEAARTELQLYAQKQPSLGDLLATEEILLKQNDIDNLDFYTQLWVKDMSLSEKIKETLTLNVYLLGKENPKQAKQSIQVCSQKGKNVPKCALWQAQ